MLTRHRANLRRLGQRILRIVPPKARAPLTAAWNWIKEPALVLLLVFAATTAVARPFYVPSGSMEPTIEIGDELLAAKYAYGYSRYSLPFGFGPSSATRLLQRMPERGDVVVFRLPRNPDETYVKRVVGLPGDRIQMRDGRLWINGNEVAEAPDGLGMVEAEDGTLTAVPRFVETLPGGRTHPIFKWVAGGPLDNTELFVVPTGHLFMMGDNRDNSLDSRVPAAEGGVGFVPMENLVGRADVVMGSVDYLNARTILDWPGQLRLARLMKRLQ